MSDPLSNESAFIQAVQNITEKGLQPNIATEPGDQASVIEQVVANLGIAQADVFAQISDYLSNLVPQPPTEGGKAPPTFTADVDGEEYKVSLPPPVGVDLPPIGKPNLEELFGAKATDPADRFFINIAATVASIFSVFFGLGTIQAREVLQQYQATKPNVVLPPDLLADAVERNVLDFANAAAQALASGIAEKPFRDMVDLAGEPPGPVQAIELFRRELINGERFAQMIAYSRVKTEYIPDLMQLAYQTMSAADAVNLYVKGVPITADDFVAGRLPVPDTTDPVELRDQYAAGMFKRAGALPSQWDILKNAAGDSVGTQHATALLDHGDITHDQWLEIVGRSRINPIFYYAAALSNKRWLSAYQFGVIVEADPTLVDWAIGEMVKGGYSQDEASKYLHAKAGGVAKKAKGATEAQVLEQYDVGALTAAQATTELVKLGYNADSVPMILAAADARLQMAINTSAIGRIRTAYLAGRIYPESALERLSQPGTTVTDVNDYLLSEARAELHKLGIAPARIDHYLKAWQVEKDTQFKTLTPSQVGSLASKGRISRDQAIARWMAMGYSAGDADLLWQEHEPTARSLKSAVPAPGTPS